MSLVGERPWWPIQCLNKGRKKKEESERLGGERDWIEFIDLRFERWQVAGFSELCWGKCHGGLKSPQKGRKKVTANRRERARERARDKIEFIYLLSERGPVVAFGKRRKQQDVP